MTQRLNQYGESFFPASLEVCVDSDTDVDCSDFDPGEFDVDVDAEPESANSEDLFDFDFDCDSNHVGTTKVLMVDMVAELNTMALALKPKPEQLMDKA